jgi:hypothetical protein
MAIANGRMQPNQASGQQRLAIFENAASKRLGLTSADFMRKFDSGFWPHPDTVPGVMYVQSVRLFAGL